MSEDCLSLNVWTPDVAPASLRPVYVWIYGGRFIWGHGGETQYDGTALAEAGIVVVTFNYRTGVFGFLSTPELTAQDGGRAPTNFGLLDQIAALEWVQHNIAAFGGDPTRVTIGGQSAGAACVMDLVYSPRAKGLFRGAVAQSGALFPSDPSHGHLAASYRRLRAAEEQGERYLAEHGVRSIDELRMISTEELLHGNDIDEPGTGDHRPPLFRPVLDGRVFARTYADTLTAGNQHDVAVITGTNLDEDGASPQPRMTLAEYVERVRYEYAEMADEFLALYPASSDAEAGAASNASSRDRSRVSTFLWASLWREHSSSPAYTYFWTHAPPGPTAASRGAFHGSEIPYLFGNLTSDEAPWTADDHAISDVLLRYLVRFVESGDPNGDASPDWAPVDDTPRTMQLGDRFAPMPVADPVNLDFFTRYFSSRPQAW